MNPIKPPSAGQPITEGWLKRLADKVNQSEITVSAPLTATKSANGTEIAIKNDPAVKWGIVSSGYLWDRDAPTKVEFYQIQTNPWISGNPFAWTGQIYSSGSGFLQSGYYGVEGYELKVNGTSGGTVIDYTHTMDDPGFRPGMIINYVTDQQGRNVIITPVNQPHYAVITLTQLTGGGKELWGTRCNSSGYFQDPDDPTNWIDYSGYIAGGGVISTPTQFPLHPYSPLNRRLDCDNGGAFFQAGDIVLYQPIGNTAGLILSSYRSGSKLMEAGYLGGHADVPGSSDPEIGSVIVGNRPYNHSLDDIDYSGTPYWSTFTPDRDEEGVLWWNGGILQRIDGVDICHGWNIRSLSGLSGLSGYSGQSGATGPQGPQGPEGPQGPTGTPGSDGADGLPGAPGASGYSGWSGKSGWSGAMGLSGWSGASGARGLSGYSGASASGAALPSGGSQYQVLQRDGSGNAIWDWVHAH